MLTKRIIPCLDVKDGRVVKGINFINLRDAGDPVDQAKIYDQMGADELVFLDISASPEGKQTTLEVVRTVAEQVFMPLTVGGGIRTVEDMRKTLLAGADKICVNSAAVDDVDLLSRGASRFGNQCIVLSIDAKKTSTNKWEVFTHGGRKNTGIDAIEWAIYCVKAGAGEIMLTSMDQDGVQSGYDLELTKAITNVVNVPVIASGGAGTPQHFLDVFQHSNADAALAATLFHDKNLKISTLKKFLLEEGIAIRPYENSEGING
jgi:imidazole glycerol-phosphate synthase subunit HisF